MADAEPIGKLMNIALYKDATLFDMHLYLAIAKMEGYTNLIPEMEQIIAARQGELHASTTKPALPKTLEED